MSLSAKKKAKIELAARHEVINSRSLNGLGYFMDANHEHYARKYIETGDAEWLKHIPNYSLYR
jgi:hypothetical protein